MQSLIERTASRLWNREDAPDDPNLAYKAHWRVIGWLGVGLPFIVWSVGSLVSSTSWVPRSSISDYYNQSRPRDFFVGTLWTMAWFFFAYKGYSKHDDRITDLACFLALAVALVPNSHPVFAWFHLGSAVALLLVLALISCFFFTKTTKTESHSLLERIRSVRSWRKAGGRSMWKVRRDEIYWWSGMFVLAFLLLAGIAKYLDKSGNYPGVFAFETLALVAFGVAWITKGGSMPFVNDPRNAAAEPSLEEDGGSDAS